MLLGWLWSMLIYGVEGAKTKRLAYHSSTGLTLLAFMWCFFSWALLASGDPITLPYILICAATLLIPPALLVLLCIWGRKTIKREKEKENGGNR